MARMRRKPTPKERIDKLLSEGGRFPSVPKIVEAIVRLNRRSIEKLVAEYKKMPKGHRQALGIGANLLLSVLENRLAELKALRRRK